MKKEFSLLLLMVSVKFSDINIVLAQEAYIPPSLAVMSYPAIGTWAAPDYQFLEVPFGCTHIV